MIKEKRSFYSRAVINLFLLALSLPSFVVGAADLQERSRAVVKLYITSQGWDIRQPWRKGAVTNRVCTGFFIAEGILTNAHCIADSTFIEAELMGEANRIEVDRVAVSHDIDLALLKLKDNDLQALPEPIVFDSLPKLRDRVVTIGYPVGGRQISYTEGVISRIEMMNYAHSNQSNLMVQTDAAINPGNSGGPVFSDRSASCLGVATQVSRGGQGIGYFIPTPVVEQFLLDFKDGVIDGLPGIGAYSQDLENPALRTSLGMTGDQSGVRIYKVIKGSTVDNVFFKDDVLLSINGHPIYNDGQVPFREIGKIGLAYYFTSRQVGESVNFTVLRKGEILEVSTVLGRNGYSLVPNVPEFEKRPRYFEIAGLVFRVLEPRFFTKNNLGKLRRYTRLTVGDIKGLEEVVVIGARYPSDLTKGYGNNILNSRVAMVNGRMIGKLADVIEAFSLPRESGFHRIELVDGKRIMIDIAELEKQEPSIKQRYAISESIYNGD